MHAWDLQLESKLNNSLGYLGKISRDRNGNMGPAVC
jgi:hypothetical protein